MSTKTIPADGRVQVVTRDLLEQLPLTIRAEEGGADIRVYGGEDDEGKGFPLRADDEWCIHKEYNFDALGKDGLWMATETSASTEVHILKGVCLTRNMRRSQNVTNTVTMDLDQIGGQAQSAVDVANKIDQIEDALASVGGDSLLVDSASPLDVSAAEVDVDLATQSLAALTVTDDGSLTIDAATQGTLPTEQQTPVGVEDSGGTQIDPAENSTGATATASTTSTGSANAAAVNAPDGRTHVTVMWDVSGAAAVTVEASVDGANWFDITSDFIDGSDVSQPSGAETKGTSAPIGADHVRVHVDSNLNEAEISVKGV